VIYINVVIIEETSSKAQIAAFLLAILAMAERGGFEPPLGCLFPKTV
jgi:hypothetical protein